MTGTIRSDRRRPRATIGDGAREWRVAPALFPLLSLVAGVVVLTGILLIAGYDPVAGLEALWRGSFGSGHAFFSATLMRATPLLLTGLAFAFGARAGALNIGMEGQFAVGTMAATWVGVASGSLPPALALPLTLAAGVAAGIAWMIVPVTLRVRFGVTEVITTLLLNFVAEAAVSWAVTGPLQESGGGYPQSDPIAAAARLVRIVPTERIHYGLLLALVVALVMALLFRRTRAGFILDASGAGPAAARIVGGVNTTRVVALALMVSGGLAGLAGAVEVSGVTHVLYQRISPGYGFTAIAVALLGRLHPLAIIITAVLFGALEAGAGAMQREAGIPAVTVQVVQAAVIIVMVLSLRRRA
ncbi:MAG TPA: ABC transporter permease [Gemmatimonadales bacterium]|nr:ABC transporter permease [Gemmatimonadales bacterium]